jgi:hypothetical protein
MLLDLPMRRAPQSTQPLVQCSAATAVVAREWDQQHQHFLTARAVSAAPELPPLFSGTFLGDSPVVAIVCLPWELAYSSVYCHSCTTPV